MPRRADIPDVLSGQEAVYEGQIFEIPEWATRAGSGAIVEWTMRFVGSLALGGALAVTFTGRLAGAGTAAEVLTLVAFVVGLILFESSWTVRYLRFGWRARLIQFWGYADKGDRRPRLAIPAPGIPEDVTQARTSFWPSRVQRIDGKRVW